jgi:peptide/nickel transport system permease protein
VLTYVARRLLYSIPVILIASMLVFVFVRETTDPTARLRASRDKEAVVRERKRLHLDDPLPVQYGKWLKDFVTGKWGESSTTHRSVTESFRRAFFNTLQLITWGILISALIAIAIGVYSAVRQYSVLDHTFTGLSFIGLSMPPFWFGILAIDLLVAKPKDWFGLDKPLLYSIGLHSQGQSGINLDYARHLALPVATLCVQIIAEWSRYQRASMLDVLNADYVRTARAKGVRRRKVIFKHALRNALIPLITVMAIDIGLLFGGLIITEKIFSIPGMGQLFFTALDAGDVNVLLPWLVISAVFIVLFNLVADVLYGILDPRVRLT